MSATYAVAIGGLGLTIAGSGLIYLNRGQARRSGPRSGAAGLVRAFVSRMVGIAGGVMILLGLAMLVAPIAARI
jgi:hypothetical protein